MSTRKPSSAAMLKRYQHLIEISRDLASTLDLDTLLARIVNIAVDLSCAEAASILLYDQVSNQLYFQTASNLEDHPMMRGMTVPCQGSLAGWMVTHREPVLINKVTDDTRHYTQVDETIQFSTDSMLGVPMINKDTVIGVLEVINKKKGEFTEEDLDVISVLAAQAAVAIQNTRLFQQSDLIADLVHELRTPLSSICTVAYLLQRSDLPEEQRAELAKTVNEESQRLNDMATSFLDLARLESGRSPFHLSIFEVKPLLEECMILYRQKASESEINIKLELGGSLTGVEADREKIKQVVMNLLNNAVTYNRPGGTITLRGRSTHKQMIIEVGDTGVGIPPDALPHLFEKFFRVNGAEQAVPGRGLGLAICKRIIENHRGRIEVRSQMEKGTTFLVYLPLRQG